MGALVSSQAPAAGPGIGRSLDRFGARSGGTGVVQLVAPAYMTAALFVFTAALDIYTLAWPLNPTAIAWRFGTVGAASNYLITAFFGVGLACWIAAYFGHGRTLRWLGVISGVCGVVLLAVLADFSMNVLQLRSLVAAEEAQAFRVGSAKAGLKYVALAGAFLTTAICAWRGGRFRAARG